MRKVDGSTVSLDKATTELLNSLSAEAGMSRPALVRYVLENVARPVRIGRPPETERKVVEVKIQPPPAVEFVEPGPPCVDLTPCRLCDWPLERPERAGPGHKGSCGLWRKA